MSENEKKIENQPLKLEWPIEEVISFARRYALTHGLLSLVSNNLHQAMVIPFSLYPSPYSFENFQFIWSIQENYNRLYQKVSLDEKLLEEALAPVLPLDDFVARLWTINRRAARRQPIQLDIYRNDYMFDTKVKKMREIEFNTISAAFAGLTGVVSDVQKTVLKHSLNFCSIRELKIDEKPSSDKTTIDFFFPNQPAKKCARAMLKALEFYPNERAAILFVIIPQERNVSDQNGLIDEIENLNPQRKVFLKTFEQLNKELIFDEQTGRMFLGSNEQEIGLVYFRSGYIPEHYVDEACWTLREKIEQSLAIKCPTVRSQLAGCKLVQEYLSRDRIVEKFIEDRSQVEQIRSTFARMFRFDDLQTRQTYRKLLIENSHDFVLKPQREGGGNNKYDDELLQIVQNHDDQLDNYIAMEKIRPPTCRAILVKANGENILNAECVNEIGIYGAILSNVQTGEEILNETNGYLVRTKTIDTNEGGVASGFSVLDSLNFAPNAQNFPAIFSPNP